MKILLPILLCLCLSGCAFIKDSIGGTANVPVGFSISHACIFNYPTHASVIGFRFVMADGTVTCGQVMLPVETMAELSKVEVLEYIYAQFTGGQFAPCKETIP